MSTDDDDYSRLRNEIHKKEELLERRFASKMITESRYNDELEEIKQAKEHLIALRWEGRNADYKKSYDSVRLAIDGAIKEIKKADMVLCEHFQQLKKAKDFKFSYNCPPGVKWKLFS